MAIKVMRLMKGGRVGVQHRLVFAGNKSKIVLLSPLLASLNDEKYLQSRSATGSATGVNYMNTGKVLTSLPLDSRSTGQDTLGFCSAYIYTLSQQ